MPTNTGSTSFTFALNPRDQTPEWTSERFLVQVLCDGTIAAFTPPRNDYDLYEEVAPGKVEDPLLDAMVDAARAYLAECPSQPTG